MSEVVDKTSRAHSGLARWIHPDRSDRYVPATTLCLFPRLPHRLRARREGCEVTLRCYDCIGCREFEALRLARRLVETYRSIAAAGDDNGCRSPAPGIGNSEKNCTRLFAVRVYCPAEIHAVLSRMIHRWRGVEIEPGFFRAGVESFIVLSRDPAELVARLRRRRLRLDVRSVGDVKRLRSWRRVARGLIVPRSAYGENINRWYRRGLVAAEKENWEVEKIAEYKTYDRSREARVVSESLGRLVPPEVLELLRGSRVRLRNAVNRATSPEQLDRIMPEVLGLIRRIAKPLVVSAVPKTAEELARSRRAYEHVARLESARTDRSEDPNSSPLSLLRGVSELLDNSSSSIEAPAGAIHSSGAPPPRSRSSIAEEAAAVEASEKHRAEFLAQRSNKKLHEAIARLRELADKFGR